MAFAIDNRKPLSRYRPPPHRSLRPLPPRWADHEDAMARSPLAQFILLSMLLHAMAILLFGAPSGGSREGRAMWGALNVVIRGPLREEKIEAPAPRAPAKPAMPREPRAEKKPAIPETKPAIPDASKEAAVGKAAAPPVPPILARPPDAAPERPPAFEVPPPTASQPAPAPAAQAPAAEAPAPAPPVAAPAPEPPVPVREVPAVELPSMPRLERAEPLPVERLIAPPPAPEREIAPIELKALPRMEALQPLPPLPVEAMPSPVERMEAPPRPAPAPQPPRAEPRPVEPARMEPPRVESPRIEPPIEAPAVQPSPFRPPSPSAAPRKDEASPDYDPTAAAPSLDAEALRKRAGELARQGTGQRAVLAFPMPPIPARKSKMEEAIENARKPDCRTAYQSLGLAAVVPLIANQFGEGNCRW